MRLTPLANHRSLLPASAAWLILAFQGFWHHGPSLASIHQMRLRLAILDGDAQATRRALELGADPNTKHGAEASPLACALASRWKSGDDGIAVAQALIQAGANPSERLETPLRESLICKALRGADLSMSWLLMGAGADLWDADASGKNAISDSLPWLRLEDGDPRKEIALAMRRKASEAEKKSLETQDERGGFPMDEAKPLRL